MSARLPRNFDIRKRPDGKWDVWALLPDPQLGHLHVKSWQIVAVCPGGTSAANEARSLDKQWRTPCPSSTNTASTALTSNPTPT